VTFFMASTRSISGHPASLPALRRQVATLVVKTNVAMEHRITDSTEEVAKWFSSQKWDTTRGFPIIRRI
jgi:hypothetical protein